MPALHVLAGANGSGKTTFYFTATEQGLINAFLPFINVDIIARDEAGGYSAGSIAIAEELVRHRIRTLTEAGQDFMIESNLARSSDYEWLEAMRQKGYTLALPFPGTRNLNVNQERVREGGHDVAANIVTQRYRMGISYLRSKLHLFDTALFD